MLSYRHAFHAGNPADVLKHFVLVELLQHLNQKDKPYWYIDTHAGAGGYALDSGFAAKNAEYASGIARLWAAPDLPPQLATYVDLVRAFNSGPKLRAYPGSPMIARALLRDDDRMRLFELHTADNKLLNAAFAEAGRSVKVEKSDGFSGLRTLLPPPKSAKTTGSPSKRCATPTRGFRAAPTACGIRSCTAWNRATCRPNSNACRCRPGCMCR